VSGAARACRSAAAIIVAVAVVIGVPVALVVVIGWPLPTALPAWSAVVTSVRDGAVGDVVVVKTLACVVWIAWAQLSVAICWELAVNVGRVSVGKPKRRAPALVNPQLGTLAAKLVGAMLVLTISARSLATDALPPAPAAITATLPALEVTPAPPSLTPARAGGECRWVVQPGETLWAITERACGNPDRLGEVIALNADQLTRPRDLRAGMVLQLPPDAIVPVDRRTPVPVATVPADHAHTIVVGENLWSISADALRTPADPHPANGEIAPYWRSVIAANTPPIRDPNLIYPGEEVLLPPTPAEDTAAGHPAPPFVTSPAVTVPPGHPTPPAVRHSATTPTPSPPVTVPAPPSAPSQRSGPPAAAHDATHAATGFPGWVTPAGLAGATLLATWATLEARRRRSYRLRRARGGAVMPPPDPTIAPTAVAIAVNTDLDSVERLDVALRHLATIDAGPVLPRPQVILSHRNGEIEVFLASPVERAADPWTARAGGQIWALAPEAELPDVLDVPAPCPALVQLGVCDDGAELYADLESLGAVGVSGPPETARQIARALTATLVVSPAARHCRVLTWGFDPYGLDGQAPTRLFVAPTLDAIFTEAHASVRPIVEALEGDPGIGSSFRLRASEPDEGFEPAIVVAAGTPLSVPDASALVALAGPGGRGAAVVLAGADTAVTLTAAEPGGWWRLNPFAIRVQPVGLAGEELREIAAYLADADAEPVAVDVGHSSGDLRERPGDGDPSEISATPAVGTVFAERQWQVMVRLLGLVDVVNRDGRTAAGDRDQPLELLAWVVTHRDTATRTGAMEALWAGRRVDPRTFTNVVSRARNLFRTLAGEPSDGGEWIPGRRERLVLHPSVVSDCELLLDRLARARRLGPADAAAVLSGGVPLLRGAPLQGAEWQWADDQSIRSRLAVQAVELATRLATLRLEAGDLRGASEASDLGHAVIPFHDECTALAIQALAASGDRSSALAKCEDYERQAMARGEAVAPEVAKLRNDLLRA